MHVLVCRLSDLPFFFYRFALTSKKNEAGKRKQFLLIFCHTCTYICTVTQTITEHRISCNNPHKTIVYIILNYCFRYLATGDSHQTIAFSFRVGRSTVSNIVKEVCQELWNVLQPLYLPTQVAGACECGEELSDSIKRGEFLDQLQTS